MKLTKFNWGKLYKWEFVDVRVENKSAVNQKRSIDINWCAIGHTDIKITKQFVKELKQAIKIAEIEERKM